METILIRQHPAADQLAGDQPQGNRQLQILRGLSPEIQRSEWVALTGPSGSGKSTLLGILAGIDRPQLRSGDVESTGNHQPFRAAPGAGAQPADWDRLSVLQPDPDPERPVENVEVPLYIHPKFRHVRSLAEEMLDLVGLAERRKHLPHQLSGVANSSVLTIARALVTQPALLLADEPTGNLDSQTGEQVLGLIARLRRQFGLTVMMVTHDCYVPVPMPTGCCISSMAVLRWNSWLTRPGSQPFRRRARRSNAHCSIFTHRPAQHPAQRPAGPGGFPALHCLEFSR